MESSFPVGVGGNHGEFATGSPDDWIAHLQLEQIPTEFTMQLPLLGESGAADHSSNHSTAAGAVMMQVQAVPHHLVGLAGPTAAAGAEILLPTQWGWAGINPGPSQIHQEPLYSAGDIGGMQPESARFVGFDSNMREVNATHTPCSSSAAVAGDEDILPVVNGGLAHPPPELYSCGDTSCCTSAADTGSISLHLEVNADGPGLPQSGEGCGGFALAEAAVRGSCKRKKLARGSSSQRSTPPEFNSVELETGLVQSYLSSSDDIKPPPGSTDVEILKFIRTRQKLLPGQEVNRSVAEQDQTAPVAARSYSTTVAMIPDLKSPLGYWKEKQAEVVQGDESGGITSWDSWLRFASMLWGFKRTFQFHRCDGTKTNWFMHEYAPTRCWGMDLFMQRLRFREVYEGEEAQVPGEPTSPEVKIKNKIAAAKKHRMRGPENLVIKGESPAWQHFIKIYDRHPELEGSKVVYGVCFHCEGVLKAGTENGTKSLLTHCNRTCPTKNKNQLQPVS